VQLDLWDSDDAPVPREELLRQVRGVDGLVCVLTEKIDTELLDAAGWGRGTQESVERQTQSNAFIVLGVFSRRSKPEGAQHHVGGIRPSVFGGAEEKVTLLFLSP